mgnify:CR=1 FL=1
MPVSVIRAPVMPASGEPIIEVQNISKVYPLYRRPMDRLLEILPGIGNSRHADFHALKDISLTVHRGEVVAFVGPNGSGKSTLLQIICGVMQPTTGRVLTQGRIASLLELGAGFNPELTGVENVWINAEVMGLSRSRIAEVFPRIEAFAGIGWLRTFKERPGVVSAFHLYAVEVDYRFLGLSRAEVMEKLKEAGVGTQVHYIPVHYMPYYRDKYGYKPGDFPAAEAYYEAALSLPLYPKMSDDDVDYVVRAVKGLAR